MSGDRSSHQTLSFLLNRFAEAGIQPKTQLGQHFLIDLNLLDLLVRTASPEAHDVVLEVGTGTGSLTARLAPLAAAVVTVEIDPAMADLARSQLAQFANVRLLQRDALKGKNRLDPEVLQTVWQELEVDPNRHFKVVANLPYAIATPLLTNLLTLDRPPETMTVTIQKELADRILAQPGTKDYGSLSIWIQSQSRPRLVRTLPPMVFWPRPKVDSAILQIVVDSQLRARITDRKFFHEFVRAIFLHRRKFLRAELLSVFKGRLDRSQVDAVVARLGLGADARAEQLSVESMLALAQAVQDVLS